MSTQRSKTVVRPHFTFASLHGLSLVDRSLINEEPVGVPLLNFSLLGDCKELLANLHQLQPAHPTQPAQPAQAAQPGEAASQLRARHASSAASTHQPPWLFNSRIPAPQHPKKCNNVLLQTPGPPDEAGGFSCVELTNGLTRIYRPREGDGWEGWDMVESLQTHRGRLVNLVKNYILPQGYPESVAPQYGEYMAWRGVQYFFGGAISVYTTKSLLGALGVAGRYSGEASAAINWVIKDGAGRLGRLLFARWGRELDCELKQFRLAGDLLMEGGAAVELATIVAPRAFLPLACTANLAKNLAAVAASSTRAPIYRTFALQNNLADITAKGESVANLADILGTVAGIMLSRMRGLPLLPTFCVLSAGYLVASRREVDAVELPYLNRARLGYSVDHFLTQGLVPSVGEANHNEPLLPGFGFNNGRVLLGSRVEAAFQGQADLQLSAACHQGQRYLLSYQPGPGQVHVVLMDGATSSDCLRASLAAHLLLFLLDSNCTLSPALAPALAHTTFSKALASPPPAPPSPPSPSHTVESSRHPSAPPPASPAAPPAAWTPAMAAALPSRVLAVLGPALAATAAATTQAAAAAAAAGTVAGPTPQQLEQPQGASVADRAAACAAHPHHHHGSRHSARFWQRPPSMQQGSGTSSGSSGSSSSSSSSSGSSSSGDPDIGGQATSNGRAGADSCEQLNGGSASSPCPALQPAAAQASHAPSRSSTPHPPGRPLSPSPGPPCLPPCPAHQPLQASGGEAEGLGSWGAALQATALLTDALYPEFVRQAEAQGWRLAQTMLNPKETRLLKLSAPLLDS